MKLKSIENIYKNLSNLMEINILNLDVLKSNSEIIVELEAEGLPGTVLLCVGAGGSGGTRLMITEGGGGKDHEDHHGSSTEC